MHLTMARLINSPRFASTVFIGALVALALPTTDHAELAAQEAWRPAEVTTADYQRAERMLAEFKRPLVTHNSASPTWLDGGEFWYQSVTAQGYEIVRVDAADGDRELAFDHAAVASGLSALLSRTVDQNALAVSDLAFEAGNRVRFEFDNTLYVCGRDGTGCQRVGDAAEGLGRNYVTSPDGTRAVFIRDHNLWMVNVGTGIETALTTDGIENYGYATNDAGWTRSDVPVVRWAPDSRRIATFRHDGRGVSQMYLVSTNVGAPELQQFNYPLPEDSLPFMVERIIIDTDSPGEITWLQMDRDAHRSTICDHIYCSGTFSDVDWATDGEQLAFVSSSRDHKVASLRVTDPATGAVRDVLEERVETFFESGYNNVNWSILFETNEVIWYSQRSDWGHLYLYDLDTGEVKHPITQGDWNVLQVRYVDHENREIYFTGNNREDGDPYFHYFYKVDIDSGEVTLLTPELGHHEIDLAPDADYFVDTWSTPTMPQTIVTRDSDGDVVVEMERADVTRLVASGWKEPIPFTTKARDGVTDLYGIMYTPSNMQPGRKYPVVNYLYPGPQSGSVGSRSFSPARRDHQAIAELGFIVVEVDAMGTPQRSKSFHDAYYGNMGDNGLPDQITTIQQLAQRHDFIDIDRVGIWGHSGGGFASTAGILRYPDFYDVAVSQAGNHDNRNYEDDWGEKWQGLLVENADGSTNYDNQANHLQVENLKGKLLLAHGTVDDNVPPYNTLLVADALIEANKDFDLIMMTNRRHGFGNEPYMMRRRWDYFVTHLLGAETPKEFVFGAQRPIT